MRQALLVMVSAVWLGALGCGSDGATAPAPGGDGAALARQFEELADSVDDAGYSPTAGALRHAAEIARLTGHATPVTLTIDGVARGFLAVAEQLDFPNLQCGWPGDTGVAPPPVDTVAPAPTNPDSGLVDSTGLGVAGDSGIATPPMPGDSGGSLGCTVVGVTSVRTFIAWEPERMAEVVRIVADIGRNDVEPRVPDVMAELPTHSTTGDSTGAGGGAGGSGGYVGFFGEYLVREVGGWYAVEGHQANALESSGGACTADRATLDWAEFECEAARFRFEFGMRVEPLRYEPLELWAPGYGPPTNRAEGSHALALAPSGVDGVRLGVVAWTPPPVAGPGPEPTPPDSAISQR
jgi:hypothetical protein